MSARRVRLRTQKLVEAGQTPLERLRHDAIRFVNNLQRVPINIRLFAASIADSPESADVGDLAEDQSPGGRAVFQVSRRSRRQPKPRRACSIASARVCFGATGHSLSVARRNDALLVSQGVLTRDCHSLRRKAVSSQLEHRVGGVCVPSASCPLPSWQRSLGLDERDPSWAPGPAREAGRRSVIEGSEQSVRRLIEV